MKIYVLAAGYGTRLGARGHNQAKALIELGGRPVLSHLLERAWSLGKIDQTVVISNHRFAQDFETWRAGVADPHRVQILDDGSTSAENRLGALGDLALAFERVPPGDSDVLVLAGDNLLNFDLTPARDAYVRHGETTLLVRHRRLSEPGDRSRYNEVVVDESGRVTVFREKPERPESPLAAIAVYFFPANIPSLLGVYLADGGEPDAPGHFIAWLVREVPVRAVALEGIEDGWHDIGDLESLSRAEAQLPGGDGSA